MWQALSKLKPHQHVKDIRSIDFNYLRNRGIEGIIFDKDNTLTAPYVNAPHAPLVDALKECMEVMGGRVLIFSNHAGSRKDPHFEEGSIVEKALGVPVLKHNTRKPQGHAEVARYFGTTSLESYAVVGDRLLTDVVFGHRGGCYTILVDPITEEGDHKGAAVLRRLEHISLRMNPARLPTHPFFDT